jgi:tetratricopeptide (TPR) repeat protein
MASIFLYNLKGGKCVELSCPGIGEEDIARLKASLPERLEGLAFESPLNKFHEESISEIRVEDRASRVAEYLKGIGAKLEKLHQVPGAVGFYDLAFRISGNRDYLMLKARTLGQAGQVERSERLMRLYAKSHPDSPEPQFQFGKNALSRNDYQAALSHFQQALQLTRGNVVEHRQLTRALEIYIQFVTIYIDRDRIFSRDLPPEQCMEEIKLLQTRTRLLAEAIRLSRLPELEGMVFFLETQEKIFDKWLEEMKG